MARAAGAREQETKMHGKADAAAETAVMTGIRGKSTEADERTHAIEVLPSREKKKSYGKENKNDREANDER